MDARVGKAVNLDSEQQGNGGFVFTVEESRHE